MTTDHDRSEWLARRRSTWGSSEFATLFAAYDLVPFGAKLAGWQREGADYYSRLGLPKIIAWKSGLAPRPTGGASSQALKDAGNRLERQVLTRWQFTTAHEHVDPRTVEHASSVPSRFFPLVDRRCPAIAVSPDAWAYGYGTQTTRDFVVVEVKTSRDMMPELPWGYVQQVRSQMDVIHARRGVVPVGERWLDDEVPESERRIVTHEVFPDERDTAMRYAVATEALRLVACLETYASQISMDGMDDVTKRRTAKQRKAAAAMCAALWEESRDRIADAWRSTDKERIDSALREIDGLDEILSRQSA